MELFYLAASCGALVVGFVVYHLSTYLMSEKSYDDQFELRRRQLAAESSGTKQQTKRKEKQKSELKTKKKAESDIAATRDVPQLIPVQATVAPAPPAAPLIESVPKENKPKENALKETPKPSVNARQNNTANVNGEQQTKHGANEQREVQPKVGKHASASEKRKVPNGPEKQKSEKQKSILIINGSDGATVKQHEDAAAPSRSGRIRTVSFSDETPVEAVVAAPSTSAPVKQPVKMAVELNGVPSAQEQGVIDAVESKKSPKVDVDVEAIKTELNAVRAQLSASQKHAANIERELRSAFEHERERLDAESGRRVAEANKLLEDLRRRADAAQRDADAVRAQLAIVQREHEQVVLRANSAEQQRRVFDERARTLEAEVRRVRAERSNESLDKDTQKVAELEKLRSELNRLRAVLTGVEQERDHFDTLRKQVEKHVDDLKAREQDLTRELESALTRERAIQTDSATLHSEKQSLVAQLAELRQRLLSSESQHQAKLDDVTQRLTRERDTIRLQLDEQSNRVAELSMRLEEAEKKLDVANVAEDRDIKLLELQEAMEKSHSENESLRSKAGQLSEVFEAAKRETESLHDELANLRAENETLKQQLHEASQLQSESGNLQVDLDRLNEQLNSERNASAQHEEALRVANELLGLRTKTLEAVNEELANLQSIATQQDDRYHELTEQLSAKDREIHQLNEQMHHIEKEKNRVLQEVQTRIREMESSIESDRTEFQQEIAIKDEILHRLETQLGEVQDELRAEQKKSQEMETKMMELETRCATEQNHHEDAKRRLHDLLEMNRVDHDSNSEVNGTAI